MAKSHFQFKKRQKELARKKKKEQKRQAKLSKKEQNMEDGPDVPQDADEQP